MDTPKLLVHLPLDEIRNAAASDVSGFGNHAVIAGNPDLVYDEDMGSTIFLNGGTQSITLPAVNFNGTDGWAVEMWFKIPPTGADPRGCVLLKVEGLMATSYMVYGGKHWIQYFQEGLGTGTFYAEIPGVAAFGAWIHLAIQYLNGKVEIYTNGNKAGEWQASANADTANRRLNINGFTEQWIKAVVQLSHLRVYQGVLALEDIRRDMNVDKTLTANYRNIYPIEFDLQTIKDDSALPHIYIEHAGGGETLEIVTRNISDKAIDFKPLTQPLGINSYHLQLRLRKNVLAESFLNAFKAATAKQVGDWNYACGYDPDEKEDWISFARRDDGFTLGKGNIVSLQIPQVNAAAMGGARNTRAEILFDNLSFATAPEKISGYMMRLLEVVNHTGLKNLPLVAFIEGSNTLLNDNSSNTFKIIITNPTANPVKLSPFSTAPDAVAASRFVLSYNDVNQPDTFTIAVAAGLRLETPSAGDISRTVTFTGLGPDNILGKGQRLEINITDWKTDNPSGLSNLTLQYFNIPGYWDGMFSLALELSPIAVRRVGTEERVGIGLVNPEAKLHLKGTLKVEDQVTIGRPDKSGEVLLTGAWEDNTLKHAKLSLINKDFGIGAGHHDTVAGDGRDALMLWAFKGPKRGIGFAATSDGAKNKFSDMTMLMFIQADTGNIGIGTKEPTAKLDIRGGSIVLDGTNFIQFGREIDKSRDPDAGKILVTDEGLHIIGSFSGTGKTYLDRKLTIHSQAGVTVNGSVTINGRIKDTAGSVPPVGSILAYAGAQEPVGWFFCRGQVLDKNTYPELFAAIGYQYGGSNNNFNLPDMRTRFITGANGSGEYTLGYRAGEEKHTLSLAEMPSHHHNSDDQQFALFQSINNNWKGGGSSEGAYCGYRQPMPSKGGDQPHENRPPYIALNYIIKH